MQVSQDCKVFTMIRRNDETGISGTGRVLDGVVWPNGWVTICWRTELDNLKKGFSSITLFESFAAFESIHITSHPTNNTEIEWVENKIANLEEIVSKNKETIKNLRTENRTLKVGAKS
jgi:hypothetical protein